VMYGRKPLEKQREFPIVALGSVWWDSYGFRYVAFLDRGASERRLGLNWLGFGWGAYYRFAAVRK